MPQTLALQTHRLCLYRLPVQMHSLADCSKTQTECHRLSDRSLPEDVRVLLDSRDAVLELLRLLWRLEVVAIERAAIRGL